MTVVAGVDNSLVSEQVVARAIEQARWRDSAVHLVHVSYSPMIHADVPIDWTEVTDAQRAHVWSQLETAISRADVPIEKIDLDGYPPDRLVGYANEVEAGLLVVGTRGHGELASLVLGSTSHRAIHLAACDVLVVKVSG